MGLIRAAIDATASTMADTWKDYFTCDALDNETLVLKAIKKGSNKGFFRRDNSEDNYITDGSGIVVSDGQCMIIVDDGIVSEVCAEPGLYTFDSSSAPSFFGAGFTQGVKNTFNEIVKRFEAGGISRKDSRIYYFNTKEILGNKFGIVSPVPFRVIDRNTGLDIDVSIRCNGEYSFQISDPLLFYTNVCGNDPDSYQKDILVSQMKAEFLNALQPSLAKISMAGVRYSEVPLHTTELCDALNENLSTKWSNLRGIKIVSLAINSMTMSKEDEEMVKNIQKSSVLRDERMAAATLVGAQADAMRDAAKNTSGAMAGFMGMNMANMMGGANAQGLFAEANTKQAVSTGNAFCPKCGATVSDTDIFCGKCGSKLK